MTKRPSTALFALTPTLALSRAERLGPFQEACLDLAEKLTGNQPQTKNGIEARLQQSRSVLQGNKYLLTFHDTGIARKKLLEVTWKMNDTAPKPEITERLGHLDALGLVQSFLGTSRAARMAAFQP